jgi:lysophospholipase L1-like esterase
MRMVRWLFARHPALTVLFLVLAFVGAEAALQLRLQLATGRSVFTAMFAEPTKVFDAELGFETFRPNARIGGGRQTVVTNGLGFRSPPLVPEKAPGVLRLAFVGASTVFGAYTPRNEALMSYRAADALGGMPDVTDVELFNAGLPGRGLGDQLLILERRVLPWQPDVVVFYPGMNDVSAVCRPDAPGDVAAAPDRLEIPRPALPGWLLSVELLRKNTLFLRPDPDRGATGATVTTADIPFDLLRARMDELLAATRRAGALPVVATLARAYHPEQPGGEQQRLSASMRYYHDCFDLPALHTNVDTFNDMLRAAAAASGAPVVELAAAVPPGDAHFADATHFSVRGEAVAAEAVAAVLGTLLTAPTGKRPQLAGE